MLDFPNAPTVGQKYPAPPVANVPVYVWDGEKWTTLGGSVGGKTVVYTDGSAAMTGPLTVVSPPVNATDAASKAYVDSTSVSAINNKVNRTGDTMSGQLAISYPGFPGIVINKIDQTGAVVGGHKNGVPRWGIQLGDSAGESGGGVGSNFSVDRYDDSGNYINSPIGIDRGTGKMTYAGDFYDVGNFSCSGTGTFGSGVQSNGNTFTFGGQASTHLYYTGGQFIFQGGPVRTPGGLYVGPDVSHSFFWDGVAGVSSNTVIRYGDGYFTFQTTDGAQKAYLDQPGNLWIAGGLTALGAANISGTVQVGALNTSGAIYSGAGISTGGGMHAATDITADGNMTCYSITINGSGTCKGNFSFTGGIGANNVTSIGSSSACPVFANADIYGNGLLLVGQPGGTNISSNAWSSGMTAMWGGINYNSSGNTQYSSGTHRFQDLSSNRQFEINNSSPTFWTYGEYSGLNVSGGGNDCRCNIKGASDGGTQLINNPSEFTIYTNDSRQINFAMPGIGSVAWCRQDNVFLVSNAAQKPGGGAWGDSSDIRIKNVTGDYAGGLDEILKLSPVTFTFKGNETFETPTQYSSGEMRAEGSKDVPVVPYRNSPHYHPAIQGKEFVGLIAQDTLPVMPEMVTTKEGYIDGVKVSDLHDIDTTPLLYALINAVKTLTDRIKVLEGVATEK